VLSTLRYFRDEYERHIIDKRCDAYVCKQLTGAPCQAACPVGTEAWRYAALITRGEYEEAYRVIRATNPFPSVCARVCDHQCEERCRLATSGQQPLALRALKRFVTDHVDPSVYRPVRHPDPTAAGKRVAVVGAGPAGLTAAHVLSLSGYKTTVFEAEDRPGGMLVSGIPAYRLPRDVLQREIEELLDENVTLRCATALGRDFSIDSLFEDGYDAVFLALGAHRSRRMGIDGEDLVGVYPSIEFLKAWNLRGEPFATGKVGVIGGGNSALDAARVSLRQKGVSEVTIFYRRTRQEMPAFEEEIEGALQEGVQLELGKDGRFAAVEFIDNELGEPDASGRRTPVAKSGSEHRVPMDTLIVAIGENAVDVGAQHADGIEMKGGAVVVDRHTLTTARPGVFAGGDVATGPNTVIDAIAAGRRAAEVIDRYLQGRDLRRPAEPRLPSVYVEPAELGEDESHQTSRVKVPTVPANERTHDFAEVEDTLAVQDAAREAARCLRCDLEFTTCRVDEEAVKAASRGDR
jgi:NADH-quinone oxidoreductase subunit F